MEAMVNHPPVVWLFILFGPDALTNMSPTRAVKTQTIFSDYKGLHAEPFPTGKKGCNPSERATNHLPRFVRCLDKRVKILPGYPGQYPLSMAIRLWVFFFFGLSGEVAPTTGIHCPMDALLGELAALCL